MTDIVERLREPIDSDDPDLWKVDRDRRDAADEIERLRAEVYYWKGFVPATVVRRFPFDGTRREQMGEKWSRAGS